MGDNIEKEKQVAATGFAFDEQWLARVNEAIAFLSPLDDSSLDQVVWDRVSSLPDSDGLPLMEPDERPSEIFIDVVRLDLQALLSNRLRASSGRLLRNATVEAAPPLALSELCYLAARISALEAVPPLIALAEREEPSPTPLFGRLTLYKSVLKSLGGLIADLSPEARQKQKEWIQPVLIRALQKPGCEFVALATLIGAWPKEEEKFRALLPATYRLDELALRASIDIAFERPAEASAGR